MWPPRMDREANEAKGNKIQNFKVRASSENYSGIAKDVSPFRIMEDAQQRVVPVWRQFKVQIFSNSIVLLTDKVVK
jgi:hypothetical protein